MAAATATTATLSAANLLHSSSSKLKQPSSLLFPPSNLTSRRGAHPLRFSAIPKISAAISVGDKLPDSTLSYFDASDELQTVSVSELTSKKKTILVAVPGAFTPTCSQKHLPGFVEKAAEFKAKGVDTIACISVNDAFVMKAWKEDLKIGDEVLLLSDGNGDFTRAIECELDLSDKPVGLGVRSRRYAMYVDDGVVKTLNLEDGGAFNVSSAEDLLNAAEKLWLMDELDKFESKLDTDVLACTTELEDLKRDIESVKQKLENNMLMKLINKLKQMLNMETNEKSLHEEMDMLIVKIKEDILKFENEHLTLKRQSMLLRRKMEKI